MFSYDMDDADEESDVLDTSDPRDSAASPEELNEEDGFGENENVSKTCTYDGCTETTTQVAKQRKPWMCKKHRNKMYKDKYKKKKSDQAMSSGKQDVRVYLADRQTHTGCNYFICFSIIVQEMHNMCMVLFQFCSLSQVCYDRAGTKPWCGSSGLGLKNTALV
jgi:hypothetical protein